MKLVHSDRIEVQLFLEVIYSPLNDIPVLVRNVIPKTLHQHLKVLTSQLGLSKLTANKLQPHFAQRSLVLGQHPSQRGPSLRVFFQPVEPIVFRFCGAPCRAHVYFRRSQRTGGLSPIIPLTIKAIYGFNQKRKTQSHEAIY